MWCKQHHPKLVPYVVESHERDVSLFWHQKKWLQKFGLTEIQLNTVRGMVKEIISNLELLFQSSSSSSSSSIKIDIIGSFLYHSICFNISFSQINNFNVDLMITMPSDYISREDVVKEKYLEKRNSWITKICKDLNQQKNKYNAELTFLNGDSSKPIVAITNKTQFPQCTIRLLPCMDINSWIESENNDNSSIFDIENHWEKLFLEIIFGYEAYPQWIKMTPDNNIHMTLNTSRCFYAQQVFEDILMKYLFDIFYDACKQNPNLHRSLVWIKAWWQRCNLKNEYGTNLNINTFHLTIFLLTMHHSHHIDIWDSPLIICAKWLELLSRQQLGSWLTNNENNKSQNGCMIVTSRDGVSHTNIWNNNENDNETIMNWKWEWLRQQMSGIFPVYLWDSKWKGMVNYTHRVSRYGYSHWIKQCEKASAHINLLIQELPWMENPDSWGYQQPLNPKDYDLVSPGLISYHEKSMADWLIGPVLSFWNISDAWIELKIKPQSTINVLWYHKLEKIIWKAMQDRINHLYIRVKPPSNGNITNNNEVHAVTIGLQLQSQSNNLLIVGPLADTPEEREFKTFWGSQASRKRFADGSINGAVVIPKKALAQTHSIEWIAKYILKKHIPEMNEVYSLVEPFFFSMPSHSNTSVKKAFGQLEGRLRALPPQQMPLLLTDVICLHPSLWGNRVMIDPILPHTKDESFKYVSCTLEDNIQCIPVLLQFEPNPQWPLDNPIASRYLKIAVYIRMRKLLAKYGISAIVSTTYLDVLWNGYCFRCKLISEEKNLPLLEKMELKTLPKLAFILKGVTSLHAHLDETLYLVLQWLRRAYFTEKISENMVMILVCDIFMNSDLYDTPQSAFQGLLRFLALIAEYDWLNTPYVCNLQQLTPNDESGKDGITSFPAVEHYRLYHSRMVNLRGNGDGLYTMFVVLPGFDYQSKWTRLQPQIHDLDRLVQHAKASHRHLSSLLQNIHPGQTNHFLSIFKPSIRKEFDFLIHLKSEFIHDNCPLRVSTAEAKLIQQKKKQLLLQRISKMKALKEKAKSTTKKNNNNNKDNKKDNNKKDNNKKDNNKKDNNTKDNNKKDNNKKDNNKKDNDNKDNATKDNKKAGENIVNNSQNKNERKRKQPSGGKSSTNVDHIKKKRKIENGKSIPAEEYLSSENVYVVGLDILAWFAQEISLRLDGIETYWGPSDCPIIPCRFTRRGSEIQPALLTALWDLGKGLIDKIEICQ